nr:YrhK family protein [Photobacterium sp. BZF1]
MFVIGSYFFFPSQTQNQIIGSWVFLSASMIYLLVNLHDLPSC